MGSSVASRSLRGGLDGNACELFHVASLSRCRAIQMEMMGYASKADVVGPCICLKLIHDARSRDRGFGVDNLPEENNRCVKANLGSSALRTGLDGNTCELFHVAVLSRWLALQMQLMGT